MQPGRRPCQARNMACWQARSGAVLRRAAESPEDGVLHRRVIDESVLLLSGMLLPCFVVLLVLSSTVAWYSGRDACFSTLISAFSSSFASSFYTSCGAGGMEC